MEKKKNKGSLIIVGILLAVSVIMAVILNIDFSHKEVVPVVPEDEQEEEVVKKQEGRDIWLANKAINNDYVGELIFESGLINTSFVQAKSTRDEDGNMYTFYTQDGYKVIDDSGYTGNDVYIWTNWKTGKYDHHDEGGSVFMDCRNDTDDENVVIYGHHFSEGAGYDPERVKAFTPLEKLMKQENYAANNKVKLILDNVTANYELVYVYLWDIDSEEQQYDMQYYRTSYTHDEWKDNIAMPGYYDRYIECCEKYKLYDTGVSLDNTDKTLTLQTCISGRAGELYEILVFRQTSVEYYY